MNPGGNFYLSEAYGITEERRLQLCELLTKMNNSMLNTITSVAHRIDLIADFTETAGEFAFCLYIDTIFLEKNGANLT